MPVKNGDKAPDFTLVNSADMQPVKLSDYKGKNVVLAFFPATFSGACDTEMCTFRDSLTEFNNLNAQVLGISADLPHAQKEFSAKHGLNFPILSDMHLKAIKDYGIEWPDFAKVAGYNVARRSVFVLDKNGKVTYSWLTEAQGNQPPIDDVKKAVQALK